LGLKLAFLKDLRDNNEHKLKLALNTGGKFEFPVARQALQLKTCRLAIL